MTRGNGKLVSLIPDGAAIGSIVVALAIAAILRPWLHPIAPPLFFVAVALSTLGGSIGSKLLMAGLRLSRPQSRRREQTLRRMADIHLEADRKQVEAELRHSQAIAERQLLEIEAIYQTAPVGLAILDANLRFLRINQQLAEINGIPAADHIGRTVREIVPDLADAAETLFRQVLETGEPMLNLEISGETQAQPGVHRTWIESWYPLKDVDGQTIAINAVVQEITDRKIAEAEREQALQREQVLRQQAESTEAIQQVLTSLREDFILFDRNWQIVYLNAQAAESMRRPRAEILGCNIWELFPDLVGTALYDRLHQVMRDRTATQFEYYYPTWNCWFENRVYPVPDGVVNLCTDITDRKRAELNDRFLSDLDRRLRQQSDAEAMAAEVVSSLGEYFKVNLCLWHEVDWQQHQTIVNHTWRQGNIPDIAGTYDLAAFFTPNQLEMFAAGQTLIVPDVTTHPETATYAQNYLALQVRSFVSVPCIQSDRWVASLAIDAETVRDWRSDEVALLQEIVARLWSLIEHTRTVAELRRSEAEFRLLANAMPQIVWVSDADGRLEFTNDRWTDYTGLTFEQSREQALREDLMPPEDRQQLYADFVEAKEARSPYQSQFRLIQPDGSYLYFLTRAMPIFDSQGQIRKWYGTSTDITGLKQLEEELRQKNAILNVINESSPAPMFVKDRTGRIIFANPATLEVLGKSADEVIGYRDCDLYPNLEDAIDVMTNDRRIMESGQMEVVEESPDGIRTFLGMKVPYRNEAGEVIGLIGISNDITDRVQLERDRERLLQQEQVAREAAENANRIKDEFLAVLSHELRTPLNPILGWSQLLQQRKLDANKTQMALETIERNARLQSQLIEDLLDISRILRGKLSLDAVSVDLGLVISAALETVRLAAETKSLQIETTLAPTVGMAIGDAGRLQQVVWNLLSNAVKFTPQGGQISVTLTQTEAHLQIQVIDTGKGIHPDFLPHVFDHFRQEDGATTRQFGGLGLGLAIARQIVELHGGTIAAHSLGEGQGTTFTVQLPVAAQSSQPSSPETLSASADDLSGIRILVVDDEPDSREIVAFVLEQAGAIVTCASCGIEVLQAIDHSIPDLIVSDIGMPDMDGYMLMRQVRSQGEQFPAIALTAYAGELDQNQALQAGFQQHLAKPIDPDGLVRAIAKLVRNNSSA